MDDRLIGSSGSNATHTGWSLFNLYSMIWNNVYSVVWAPIFTSAGVVSSYGASAMADWQANKQLSLTKVLGRVLAGAGQSITAKIVTVVNASPNLQIGMDDTSSFLTGTPFQVTSTGTYPGNLSPLTTYYAINTGSTSAIFVATSSANAVAGTAIAFASSGTGVITLFITATNRALGQYVGEENHDLLINEFPSHNHPGSSQRTDTPPTTGTAQIISVNQGQTDLKDIANLVIASQGGSQPHNNMQPTSFFNVMIKL